MFFMGLILSLVPFLITYGARRNFRKNPSANTIIKYLIDKDTIEIKAEGSEGKYSWDKIFRVEIRKKGILIFPQSRIAHWIPISSISNEEIFRLEKIMNNRGIRCKRKN